MLKPWVALEAHQPTSVLHLHEQIVVLICVSLHTLVTLFKLIVLCAKLLRGVDNADLDGWTLHASVLG